MITDDYSEFTKRYRTMAWTKTPHQKLVGDNMISSQWEGEHTTFHQVGKKERKNKTSQNKKQRKWHIGTGSHKTGKKNYLCGIENSSCYIHGCTEDYIQDNGKKAPVRTKLFNDFKKKAKKGDIIFIHHKKVTHWGVYTGDIQSFREGYSKPSHIPKGWEEINLEKKHIFVIRVNEWKPLNKPFKMSNRQSTLFEVTDNVIYQTD